MSRGTISKVSNADSGLGTVVTQPTLDLLTAMGHGNTSATTEEWVTMAGMPYVYNAANFGDPADTDETKINAMIAKIVADGATSTSQRFGFVPASMIPYTASATLSDSSHVLHNPAAHMVREGQGDWSEYDIVAYGAAPVGAYPNEKDSDAAFAAAIAAAPQGATIRIPLTDDTGGYRVAARIAPPAGKNLRFKGQFGSGAGYNTKGSIIQGTFNDWILYIDGTGQGTGGDGVEVSGIKFLQTNTGTSAGCVYLKGLMNAVVDRVSCYTANHGIALYGNTFVCDVSNLNLQCYGPNSTTSIGLGITGHTNVRSVFASGFGYGVKFSTAGGGGYSTLQTLRMELNTVGVMIGKDIFTDAQAPTKGYALIGCSYESNGTGIYIYDSTGFFIGGQEILNDGFGNEQYGMRIANMYDGVVAGVHLQGAAFSVGGIVFDTNGRGQVLFLNCNAGQSGWTLPTTLGGYVEFANCDTGGWIPTLTANSATPSVGVVSSVRRGNPHYWLTANTLATTITQFADGLVGTPITIQAGDTNTTIQHGTNIFLKSGANKTLASKETITLVQFTSGRWDEI